jgi:prolyl-tRNA synthetase
MGKKTDSEKFAGAEATYSIEHLLPDGKAIQGPDFHSDGQKFSKAFEIVFIDQDGKKQFVWQNTWAISTREIGVMLAVHSDDKGAVLPPKLAGIQVVVVPIVNDENKATILREVSKIAKELAGRWRTKFDDRDNLTPGRKFNEWELKGVPLRIEVGPRDLRSRQAVLVRRDTGRKRTVLLAELGREVEAELISIQSGLLERAKEFLKANTFEASSLAQLKEIIEKKGGIVKVAWCGKRSCEDRLREQGGGKIINVPLDQKPPSGACLSCGEKAALTVNYARSY